MNVFNSLSEIIPGLYLGSIVPVYEPETLRQHSIGAILSLLSEKPDFKQLDGVIYHSIQIDDFESSDLLNHLERTNQLIGQWINDGRNVYVHCAMGVSRSATVVIAFVMEHFKIGYREARELVTARREVISPNRGFCQQLALFGHLKYKLDVNNIFYRRYLFHRIVYEVDSQSIAKNQVEPFQLSESTMNYVQKLTDSEQNPPGQTSYKCKQCRRVMFSDLQVLHKDNDNLYIHILSWMVQDPATYFLPTGKIYCPHCKNKLGRYKWTHPYLSNECFQFGEEDQKPKPELKVPMVFSVTSSSVDVDRWPAFLTPENK